MTLYSNDAVLAQASGPPLVGIEAIRRFYASFLATQPQLTLGDQQLTLMCSDIALTSTRLEDGSMTVEVARRQDGRWRWIIDQPSIRAAFT
jgi:ketosteroid isomerase-like protein